MYKRQNLYYRYRETMLTIPDMLHGHSRHNPGGGNEREETERLMILKAWPGAAADDERVMRGQDGRAPAISMAGPQLLRMS